MAVLNETALGRSGWEIVVTLANNSQTVCLRVGCNLRASSGAIDNIQVTHHVPFQLIQVNNL